MSTTMAAPTTASTEPLSRFGRVIDRIPEDPEVPEGMAEAVMAETLGFIELAASVDESVAPSKLVDVGWHHFILFTRDHVDYCAGLGGYVHHVPDRPGDGGNGDAYERTRNLLADRHGSVDERLWPRVGGGSGDCEAGKCEASKCTSDCKS